MINRKETVNTAIDSALNNGEDLSYVIASLVFDKEHARNLSLTYVIDYLSETAEKLCVEDTPAIAEMIDELKSYEYYLKNSDDVAFDYELLKDSLTKGLDVLDSLLGEVKKEDRKLLSWRADPKSFVTGLGVAASLALLVSAFKRRRKQ